MAVDNSQTLRQWILLRTLAANVGGVTIKHLVEQTGVSDKTIRRDVSELREAGFPVLERVGEFGRKSFVLDGTQMPLLTFTYDEALALYLCRTASAHFTGTFIAQSLQEAFRKIRATLPRSTCEYLDRMLGRVVKTGLGGSYADKAELLDQLLIGIEDSKAVFVTYQSERSTEPVTYDLYPLGIVEHQGAIYLVGHSPDHGAIRTWKLDRMLDAEVTNVSFQRPADFDLEQFLAGSVGVYQGREDVMVRVRFAPNVARYVREKRVHRSQVITPQRDGGVVAQWRLSNTVEIRGYILSFGAAAEVLEPSGLRQEICSEVARMQLVYREALKATDKSSQESTASSRKRSQH